MKQKKFMRISVNADDDENYAMWYFIGTDE